MASNEAVTETRQKAKDEATTDRLDDISPQLSPESDAQNAPEYRADIGPGDWLAPPSQWKMNDSIYLRLKDGRTAGPYVVVRLHRPRSRLERWRYDVRDGTGRVKSSVSESILV